MNRTTISHRAAARRLWRSVAVCALAMLSGCGGDYAHKKLDADGPEAQAARQMAGALRSADPAQRAAVMDGQLIAGLAEQQIALIRPSLEALAAADQATLLRLDRYGQRVVQVIFEARTGERSQRVALLMTKTDAGYRWLGRP